MPSPGPSAGRTPHPLTRPQWGRPLAESDAADHCSTELHPGALLHGRYQLQAKLHQGPHSSVWKALEAPLDPTGPAGVTQAHALPPVSRPVVLKVLPTLSISQDAWAQHELEMTHTITRAATTAGAAVPARTPPQHPPPTCAAQMPVAQLQSSFSLPPSDCGGRGGSLVLVLAPGHESLARLLAYQRSRGRAGLPTPAVLQLARCSLHALDLAHRAAGLAHLDVKPANLLLGTPVLATTTPPPPPPPPAPATHQQHPNPGGGTAPQPQAASSRVVTLSSAQLAAAPWLLVDWGSASRLVHQGGGQGAAAAGGAGATATPGAIAGSSTTGLPPGSAPHPPGSWWQQVLGRLAPRPAPQLDPPGSGGWGPGGQPPWQSAATAVVERRPPYDTPAYAAPEVLLCAPLTPSADLWSLGATLFEAAAGVPLLQLPTGGPRLAALAHWVQRQQAAAAAASSQWQQVEGSSGGRGSQLEEVLDGAQLALLAALHSTQHQHHQHQQQQQQQQQSAGAQPPSRHQWPEVLSRGEAAAAWLTPSRHLRPPWARLAADATSQLREAAARQQAREGDHPAAKHPAPPARIDWRWRWPWQLRQQARGGGLVAGGGLPLPPLQVLLQEGRGLVAGPPGAAAAAGRKLSREEAALLSSLLSPMLALDPGQRPSAATLLHHPALAPTPAQS